MTSLLVFLQEILTEAIEKALGKEGLPEGFVAEITPATQEKFGHYQCNSALKLAPSFASKPSPRELAQKILPALEPYQQKGILDKVEVAGSGFINLTFTPLFLSREITALLQDPRLGVPEQKKERVIVEFSSPNIAKELHVGHLRSTIIGDAIARLMEFLGHDVLRLNHVGDWGTQFGMLIGYMKQENLVGLETMTLVDLMHWYKKAKERFDTDPLFKTESQREVVRLQGGDPTSLHVWKEICAVSRRSYEEIYTLLDVFLQERGESFYNPYLADVVAELESKGLVTVSEGAKCIFLEEFRGREGEPLPMIIQKSDGGYNYDTTDLAALRHRVTVEKAERIIVVTDAGQSLHFQMLIKVGEKAGYLQNTRFDHVTFGLVLGPDGKKFKTRSGDTEKLLDLLLEAVERAEKIVQERLPDLPVEEKKELAKILGINAVKYADLSCHRVKDYLFSYDRMLRFEGNTAAFVLYAYVRIQGIKRKTQKAPSLEKGVFLEHPAEISLALHLRQFGEVLEGMARDLLPHRLTDYLYILAEKFHVFFRDCRVEGSSQEESRLLLCEAALRILEKGFSILGLKTVERM